MKSRTSGSAGISCLGLIVAGLLLVGEVMCVVKMLQCDWKPVGKAEVIYTVSVFTGLGGIVGWIDIDDD